MKIEEIIQRLPSSWDTFKLGEFLKVADVKISEDDDAITGVENTLKVVSALTDISKDDLENYPMKELIKIGDRLSFMHKTPERKKKTLIQWKKIDEITYDNFITYLQIEDRQLKNLHLFIRDFSKNKMTEEEILSLSVTEVWSAFFLFRKMLLKSINTSIALTKIKLHALWIKNPKEFQENIWNLPKK